ncbi:hypothetical protein AWE51_00115 [Aquimarina aggregata]|uniref:Uncharacterized protein n=1 Tax=Aquimarina aggregata TaxID=1642818 RepID=A0A163BXZ0_9FLAO|nr:hypothetical protein [Aquimarina aggregata]KZS41885.1 hypothetical protein AWE51_00115 [Aquimarina aggregata]
MLQEVDNVIRFLVRKETEIISLQYSPLLEKWEVLFSQEKEVFEFDGLRELNSYLIEKKHTV